MKKKYRLKKWVKIVLCILFILILIPNIHIEKNKIEKIKSEKSVKEDIKKENKKIVEEVDQITEEQVSEQVEQVVEEQVEQEEVENNNISNTYETRLTSYYSNDGYGTGSCTGTGLCENDFQVNEYGWYTYQGKLVVATATEYLLKYGFTLNEGVHTYKYYQEITLNIDGVDYQAIVLDSCGSSMKNGRIDLFVSNAESVKDTTIIVKE